jgi:hypothetical protein
LNSEENRVCLEGWDDNSGKEDLLRRWNFAGTTRELELHDLGKESFSQSKGKKRVYFQH